MNKVIRIGIDIDGGDFGQQHNIDAVLEIVDQLPKHVQIVMFGNYNGPGDPRISYAYCSDIVTMKSTAHESFAHNSIHNGIKQLNNGDIDIFISTGNTGAVIANATIQMGNGKRLCLPALLPNPANIPTLLLDIGANIGCTPKTLERFAELGSEYMINTFEKCNPTVGLLNVGTEDNKGTNTLKQTFKLLKANDTINFIGNIEGSEIYDGTYDVIVCDGLIGNILIKQLETLSYLLPFFDPENYGGSQLLGIDKPVIIGHGNASKNAIQQMILKSIK